MPQLNFRFAAQQRTLWRIATISLVVLGFGLAALVYEERVQILDRESARLLHQVRIIDANLTQQLVSVNSALLNIRNDAARLASHPTMYEDASTRMRTLTDAMPGVRTMLLTDARGVVLASNRTEIAGFDASVRAYFQSAKDKPAAEPLFVSAPFKTTLNVYALNLVKTWVDAQNRFGGIVAATLDPEYFQVLLNSVLYANDMRATLIHGDGLAFLTLPDNPIIVGTQLAVPGTYFTKHMASGRTESLDTGIVKRTGDARLVAYRTVQPVGLHMDRPLVVTVSREMSAVMAPWWTLAWICGLTYAVISLVVLCSLHLLQRQQWALQQMTRLREQEMHDQAQRLDLALKGANLGLWDLDLVSGTRHVNARVQEMLGYAVDEPGDPIDAWAKKIHPDDLDYARETGAAHQRGQSEALVLEYRVQHKDGHWIWLHSRGKVTHYDENRKPLRMIGTYLDVTERKLAEAQIADFAYHDLLTGLPNRRMLMDRLSQAQHASVRSGQAGALMFLDLDRFKWVNDTLGHESGDVLLQEMAKRLLACVRQNDTVARLGGDEFVLLVQDLGEVGSAARERARILADKVLDALREPVMLVDQSQFLTTSIGIAIYVGLERSASDLLKCADAAMYRAKSLGRNSACIEGD